MLALAGGGAPCVAPVWLGVGVASGPWALLGGPPALVRTGSKQQSFFINNLYINPYLVEPQPIRIITVTVLIIHYVAFCSCIIHHHHQHGHGHDHVHQFVAASSSPALAAQWSASRMLHDCQTRLDGSVVLALKLPEFGSFQSLGASRVYPITHNLVCINVEQSWLRRFLFQRARLSSRLGSSSRMFSPCLFSDAWALQ